MKITNIKSYQIYDSRGLPTIACELTIDNKFKGLSKIPSGASTGSKEAVELRDNNLNEWMGKGVNKAIDNINNFIANKLINFPAFEQAKLDKLLIELDGTQFKNKLGANALLAISLAYCMACSKAKNKEIYEYIRFDILKDVNRQFYYPIPLVNVFNGGKHSNNNIDFQEFMFIPLNQSDWSKTIMAASECFLSLQKILKDKGYSIAKGDEGGFSVNLPSINDVLDLMTKAVNKTKYKLGYDISFGLDVAASEFYNNGFYELNNGNNKQKLTSQQLIQYYIELCNKYPIISIEDPFDENDWESFKKLTLELSDKNIQIVGDDLYCTNCKLLNKGINEKATNAILIKLNQIGTLTECLETIKLAQSNNIQTIISHRSGETEDSFIVDLCLATNSYQIKTGSMSRSERLAKYNRISYIDQIKIKLLSPKVLGNR